MADQRKGFTARAERIDPEVGFDGLFAVMNMASKSSGRYLSILSLRVAHSSGFNSDTTNILGNQGRISIDRISAYSGGTEITPVKFDTNSATLPSEVKLLTFPDSITLVSKYRQFGDCPSFGILQTISFQGLMRAPGVCDCTESGQPCEGHNVMHKPLDSALEPKVLREGEGIAAIKRAYGLSQAHHWAVIIRVVSTGATYRYTLTGVGTPASLNDPIWAIFNASGSGVIIEVWIINFPDMGESNIPGVRIARISGITEFGEGAGEISPIKHDTSADLTGVKIYKGAFRPALSDFGGLPENYWNYQGTPVTIALQQQIGVFRKVSLAGPIYTETAAPVLRFQNSDERWPGDRRGVFDIEDEIILLPGEGLAVIGGGSGYIETSEQCYVDIDILGYIFIPDTGGAAVYPVIGGKHIIQAEGTV